MIFLATSSLANTCAAVPGACTITANGFFSATVRASARCAASSGPVGVTTSNSNLRPHGVEAVREHFLQSSERRPRCTPAGRWRDPSAANRPRLVPRRRPAVRGCQEEHDLDGVLGRRPSTSRRRCSRPSSADGCTGHAWGTGTRASRRHRSAASQRGLRADARGRNRSDRLRVRARCRRDDERNRDHDDGRDATSPSAPENGKNDPSQPPTCAPPRLAWLKDPGEPRADTVRTSARGARRV